MIKGCHKFYLCITIFEEVFEMMDMVYLLSVIESIFSKYLHTLLSYCRHISNVMQYLSSKNFVHRLGCQKYSHEKLYFEIMFMK